MYVIVSLIHTYTCRDRIALVEDVMERLRKFEKKNSKKQYARAADSYSDESNVSDDSYSDESNVSDDDDRRDRSSSTESSTSTENASDFEPDDPNSDSRGDDGDEDGLGLPVQEGAELSNYPSNYAPIRPRHAGKYILRPSTGPVIPDTADTVTMTNASVGGASTDAVEMVNEIHVF